jgi:uncharacterized repeat protein (TIGR01451 family)
MRIDHANSRWGAPRLLGIAALLLGILVVILIRYSGPASAAATDLALTKSDSPDPVVQGNNVTYTITVSNTAAGAADATGVTVVDTLPSQVDFVSASSGCTHAGGKVTCDLGTVAANTSESVNVVVKTKKSGTISNTALVSADTASPDANAANNTDTEATVVSKPATAPKKKGKKKGKASCATPTIAGTAGDDVITGTSRGDVIVTFTGNDQVFAGGGGDLVCTDGGADVVFGQDGGDTVIAGSGPDLVVGGKSGDTLKGKAGRDRLKGKSGNDFLNGGRNRDRCRGGSGQDTLVRCP